MPNLWQRFLAWLNAPVAEIDGCRNCKFAGWYGDGTGRCVNTTKYARARLSSMDIYEAMPYRAEECDAWERKEKPE